MIYLELVEKKRRDYFHLLLHQSILTRVGNLIRKHLFILQSKPKLKELFPRGFILPSFRRSKNLKELLAPSRFKTVKK